MNPIIMVIISYLFKLSSVSAMDGILDAAAMPMPPRNDSGPFSDRFSPPAKKTRHHSFTVHERVHCSLHAERTLAAELFTVPPSSHNFTAWKDHHSGFMCLSPLHVGVGPTDSSQLPSPPSESISCWHKGRQRTASRSLARQLHFKSAEEEEARMRMSYAASKTASEVVMFFHRSNPL